MEERYWSVTQRVCKLLRKKEDDCIMASDSELDIKLLMLQNTADTCRNMLSLLRQFQDKLAALTDAERQMGLYLRDIGMKSQSVSDKMMRAVGFALVDCAEERSSLYVPLSNLCMEFETFLYKAIVDTLLTVEKMEKVRASYRRDLMWMKMVTQQLDPDNSKIMGKFRTVQNQVRKSKSKFDKLKLDTCQKVELLLASRANMLSRELAPYRKEMLRFSSVIAKSMCSIFGRFLAYQPLYKLPFLQTRNDIAREISTPDLDSRNKSIPKHLPKAKESILKMPKHPERESKQSKHPEKIKQRGSKQTKTTGKPKERQSKQSKLPENLLELEPMHTYEVKDSSDTYPLIDLNVDSLRGFPSNVSTWNVPHVGEAEEKGYIDEEDFNMLNDILSKSNSLLDTSGTDFVDGDCGQKPKTSPGHEDAGKWNFLDSALKSAVDGFHEKNHFSGKKNEATISEQSRDKPGKEEKELVEQYKFFGFLQEMEQYVKDDIGGVMEHPSIEKPKKGNSSNIKC